MNKVLSLLMAFVFVHVQTWAATGGPFDNPNSVRNFTGSYAGTLVPVFEAGDVNRASSIGLFTLAQPDVGPATGALIAFVNGTAFLGTINGILDPDDSSFTGVIDAQSTFTVTFFVPTTNVTATGTTTTFTREEFPVFAQGSIETEIEFQQDPSVSITSAGTPSTNFPARITGSAILEVFFEINDNGTPDVTLVSQYEVDGFKQSDSVSQTAFTFGNILQNQQQNQQQPQP